MKRAHVWLFSTSPGPDEELDVTELSLHWSVVCRRGAEPRPRGGDSACKQGRLWGSQATPLPLQLSKKGGFLFKEKNQNLNQFRINIQYFS